MIEDGVRHVLWDWNGTLLDDVDLCIDILNALRKPRRMRPVGRAEYLRLFGFPVIDYYRAVGFDFDREPFESLAQEWIALYRRRQYAEATLHEGATEVLALLRARGIRQSILSAHHRDMLVPAVLHYGIEDYFAAILGIENHYAESKLDIGMQWLKSVSFHPDEVLLVGDTRHDWDVASAMGIRCVLVPSGHQGRQRLETLGAPLLDSIRDLPHFLGRHE